MAGIGGINSGIDYSVFFGGSSTSSADGVDLTSYMSIKNGSYRRLLKNYYGSQKAEVRSAVGYDATRDYETQIKKLDKEIKEAENRLKYL